MVVWLLSVGKRGVRMQLGSVEPALNIPSHNEKHHMYVVSSSSVMAWLGLGTDDIEGQRKYANRRGFSLSERKSNSIFREHLDRYHRWQSPLTAIYLQIRHGLCAQLTQTISINANVNRSNGQKMTQGSQPRTSSLMT